MSEHTKEPWMAWKDGSDRDLFGPATNYTAGQCFHTPDIDACEANARRIVACVNACAGIPTGMLEAAGQSAVIALRPVDELVAERNALLAALKVIAWNADMYLPATIRQVATEAIAQVKL